MMRWRRPQIEPRTLIVGLGNPGAEYADTRHNIGFRVIEELARRHKIKLETRRFRSRFGLGMINGVEVCLAMPMTFMNLSGEAIASLARHFNLKPDKILIILDDMAISVGRIRVRASGSPGGHNGLKNIERLLRTQEYSRIRIGIGSSSGEAIDYVLSSFKPNERVQVEKSVDRAADAAEFWLVESIENVMNKFNQKEANSD